MLLNYQPERPRARGTRLRPRAEVRKGKDLTIQQPFCTLLCIMTHDVLSKVILDSAFRIHSALGPGLFEHVYEVILAYELKKQHLEVGRQVPIPIVYDGIAF